MASKKRKTGERKAAGPYSLGLVLTGGAAFGAWEVGALTGLWDFWNEQYQATPPITVVAGTSTGALIAPFAILERDDLDHVTNWYTGVKAKQISAPSPAIVLTTALFLKWGVSLFVFGDPKSRHQMLERKIRKDTRCQKSDDIFPTQPLLFQNYLTSLEEENPATGHSWATLERCRDKWPQKRLVACAMDFANGTGNTANNSRSDLPDDVTDLSDTRLFRAIFASCVPPLMGPPVPVIHAGQETLHFDGGIYEEAPFNALLRTAALETPLALTHILLMSSYPLFPSADQVPFKSSPKFMDIGFRFDSLVSEANVTRDTRIARAALGLRQQGVRQSEVERMTGLDIADPVPKLIEVVPQKRLDWNNSNYESNQMKSWVEEGRLVAKQVLAAEFP